MRPAEVCFAVTCPMVLRVLLLTLDASAVRTRKRAPGSPCITASCITWAPSPGTARDKYCRSSTGSTVKVAELVERIDIELYET